MLLTDDSQIRGVPGLWRPAYLAWMLRRAALLTPLLAFAGCSGLYASADAGPFDAGPADSGPGCDAGFHDCSGSCAPNESLTQCGPSCQACSAPPNSEAVCVLGGCDFVCAQPLFKCGKVCCKAVAVTAGSEHSCLLTELGGVKCWGSGAGIGDGAFNTEHLVSVDIAVGGDAGVAELSASYFNTCARLTSGSLRCWGNNAYGSVGDGTTFQRVSPVEVLGSGVSRVALGAFFSCAIVDGAVKSWGVNTAGQLGDGSSSERSSPGPVSGLASGGIGVWSGYNTACAVTDGGSFCWGGNSTGECGDGTNVNPRVTPVLVKAVDAGILELHPAGLATCAITTARGVKCFGGNVNGQCGNGTVNGPNFGSVNALGLSQGVTQLASGSTADHLCVVLDGGAYCWGLNDKGQLGDTTVIEKHAPTPVFGLPSGVRSIATGEKHTCAVMLSGGVKCWGRNFYGQLGDGTKIDHYTPVDVR